MKITPIFYQMGSVCSQHLSSTELTQLYLNGHSNLTTSVNCLVLKSSIKYIHDTEWFNKT